MALLLLHSMASVLPAQLFIPAFRWTEEEMDGTVFRTDPEVRQAGRHLVDRLDEFESNVAGSFVLVTCSLGRSLYVDRAEVSEATAVIVVRVVERGPDFELGTAPPDGRETLYWAQVVLAEGEEFAVSPALIARVLRTPPWSWYCIQYDGERQHHWLSSVRPLPAYRENLASPSGSGRPGDPARTRSSAWQGAAPLFRSLERELLDPEESLARALYAYLARGRVRRGAEPVIEADDLGVRRVIRLRCQVADVKSSPGPSAVGPEGVEVGHELRFAADYSSGLPLLHEQEMTWNGQTRYLYGRRWHVGDKFGLALPVSGITYTIAGHDPLAMPGSAGSQVGPLGMVQSVDWSFLLHYESAPPLEDHPALAPDSLAAWLGLALEWQNAEDCMVTSVPRAARENDGVPRLPLLEEIAARLDSGDLAIDLPEAWGFDPGQPMPFLD